MWFSMVIFSLVIGSTGVPSSFGNIAYSLVLLGIICNIWYWYCLCLSVWNQPVCHPRLVISDSFMVLFSMVRYGFSIVRFSNGEMVQ